MKFSIFLMALCSVYILGQNVALASESPDGSITFHNATQDNVTAQVSALGKVTLAANETKDVAYSSLLQACSSNPTNCKAEFYINNVPAGFATLNVVTGKVVNMNVQMKVKTSKGSQQILRRVVIS